MKKSAFSTLIILCAVAAGPAQVPPESGTNVVVLTPAFLTELSEEMGERHPAYAAARARTNAAAAEVGAVRTWEDPMARIGGMGARDEMRADDGDLIYGAEQKLPLFGKPKLARRVAQAGLSVEAADADMRFQELRRDLAKAAFRVALADEVVATGREDLAWLETMAQTMENKYRANQATLVEVLQIQNERARRATQLQTDRDRLEHERFVLNRFLNRDPGSPWPTFKLPPLSDPVPYTPKLVDLALRYEPKVGVLREQIKQAEASLALTRRQRLPDVSAGLEGRTYTGDGSFRQGMFVLSMNLPWFNSGKYRSEIRRDEARVRAAEFDLEDYRQAVREEVHQLTIRIDAAHREATLYGGEILPRSQSALESARAGWESGRNTFRDMLDARRMLLEAKLMYSRAVAEQYEMLAELVLCCGLGDLEALQMLSKTKSDSQQETQ